MFSSGNKNRSPKLDVHDGLPRGTPGGKAEHFKLPDARFAATEAVAKHMAYRPGGIFLGVVNGHLEIDPRSQRAFINGGDLIGIEDDRHHLVMGGTRGGKGRSLLIPNARVYPHSLLALDPKAELLRQTGRLRAEKLKQRVRRLDPYNLGKHIPGIERAGFNPVAGLNEESVIEAAALIRDALIIADGKEKHWDESAGMILESLIIHMVTDPYYKNGRVHLGTLREMLGEAGEHGRLKNEMFANGAADGLVELGAKDFFDRPTTERMGVLSTLRRHLKFLDYPEIREVLRRHDFALADLKTSATTIFLCLPARHLRTCNRWVRLLINLALQELERLDAPPATGGPVLFMIDEFATLGHVGSIEDAAGQIAGFGVKLMPVIQDLTQLKALYGERWETFVGNAGTLQCFCVNDVTSLEYLSRRLGKTTVMVPQEAPMSAERARQEGVGAVTYRAELHDLLSVHEIAYLFGRADLQSRQLVIRADGLPVVLQRVFYDLHDAFRREP